MPPFPVTVHPFPSPTPFSCAYERGPPSSKNALIFIGGLTSGPHTTDALETVFQALAAAGKDYSLWEFRMRSSYTGFGYSSLKNDAEDLAALVRYVRGLGRERIVLMGSSSGCHALLTYTRTPSYPHATAYILLSPTSDRETAALLMPPAFLTASLSHAESLIAAGSAHEAMPTALVPPVFSSPLTAYRWHSLLAPGGDDDFFASDAGDEELAEAFGSVNAPVLVLVGGEDEMVPESVDKEALLGRWMGAVKDGLGSKLSGVNPGADHTLSGVEARRWVCERVVRFLGELGD
ncbi:DUF1749-domain-containing protein [Pyrenochaeta sp. DS3sAY3a]|nr:DUF1749-domain-containing protein [Pyrenochaeta sp. DS3sAY3a]